jgi:anion-transporting  ArsA/GET3 family ATPase
VKPLRPLLEHRLVIVTGKGGTGKTSVTAALALAAAAAGRRVLVAETGRDEHVPRLIAPGGPRVGYAGRELRPGLRVMRVEPYEALTEYLQLQLPVPGLVSRAMKNKGFRQLMDAAPGWRELITLGKVWHLEQARDAEGRPEIDLLLVDAPATGHSLTFLDVPRVVLSAVRAGPLRRHAGWVEAMMTDPEHTLLLPVALPEELPARETAQLVERVRDGIGVPVDRVIVNAVLDRPFPEGLDDLDERLARIHLPAGVRGLPSPAAIARCAAHVRSRYEMGRHYVGEIARWTGLPTVVLPHLAEGIRGPDDLERLAEPMVQANVERAA